MSPRLKSVSFHVVAQPGMGRPSRGSPRGPSSSVRALTNLLKVDEVAAIVDDSGNGAVDDDPGLRGPLLGWFGLIVEELCASQTSGSPRVLPLLAASPRVRSANLWNSPAQSHSSSIITRGPSTVG